MSVLRVRVTVEVKFRVGIRVMVRVSFRKFAISRLSLFAFCFGVQMPGLG